jgi:LmbE family N-acetylglucosaminyl deacetylase
VPPGGRCRLLGIFAHPDDETFCAGGTFARYAGQGAEIMVVSATRGQAGQIRDAAAGTRRTIAAIREAELRLACERLGITKVRCLDHVDGTLADAEFPALVDEVAEVICQFRPDVVITFGPGGGYGHPDHVTISAATTAACQRAAGPGHRPGRTVTRPLRRAPRLYYRCFPPGDLLMMERLATWLTSRPDRFAGTAAFAHALLLLAEAASTLGHIRDHIQVSRRSKVFPPGGMHAGPRRLYGGSRLGSLVCRQTGRRLRTEHRVLRSRHGPGLAAATRRCSVRSSSSTAAARIVSGQPSRSRSARQPAPQRRCRATATDSGLDLYRSWSRPMNRSYQHGFSTRSGNDGN